MLPTFALEALLGFGGAFVYGLQRFSTARWRDETVPDARHRRLAWAEFANTLIGGPLFAGVFTDWVVALAPAHTPWPAVAVTIGLLGSAAWPKAIELADLSTRLKRAWEALIKGDAA